MQPLERGSDYGDVWLRTIYASLQNDSQRLEKAFHNADEVVKELNARHVQWIANKRKERDADDMCSDS